jgi:hypothetical protein
MYGQREKLPLAEEALDMNGVPSHSIYRHTVISFGVAVLSREANFPLSLTGKGAGSLAMLVQTRTTGGKISCNSPFILQLRHPLILNVCMEFRFLQPQ